MRRILLALLLFTFSSVCVASKPLEILTVEQLPYFCGARLNVLLSKTGNGPQYVRYSYKIEDGSWSVWQESSTFLFSKDEILKIGRDRIKFRVYDRSNPKGSVKESLYLYIDPVNVKITVSSQSHHPNCDDASGTAELIVKGGWRYLTFDGTTSTIVRAETRFLDNLTEFTMEGDIRLTEDVSKLRGTVGVFGLDNILEFGFRNGKPAAYISFMPPTGRRQSYDFDSNYVMPNDHQWHNMAVRSTGDKMEILIDGNVYISGTKKFDHLTSDNAGFNTNLTIGAKVWNTSDRGINGDVARVSFWNRALSNDELRNFRASPPKGDEIGLLAAYNLDVRDQNRLLPTVPAGMSDADKEKCIGAISGAQWSDKVNYVLNKKNGSIYDKIREGDGTRAVVTGLVSGDYQFIATYDAGECQEVTDPKEFTLTSTYELGAEIDITQGRNLCEGDEITLNVVKDTGGSNLVGVSLKYQWEVSGDLTNYVEIPGATSKHVRHDVGFGKNTYRVHIETSDGVCKADSDYVSVSSNKKIVTKPIKRIK